MTVPISDTQSGIDVAQTEYVHNGLPAPGPDNDMILVSIFVHPLQFMTGEDLRNQDIKSDLDTMRSHNISGLFSRLE